MPRVSFSFRMQPAGSPINVFRTRCSCRRRSHVYLKHDFVSSSRVIKLPDAPRILRSGIIRSLKCSRRLRILCRFFSVTSQGKIGYEVDGRDERELIGSLFPSNPNKSVSYELREKNKETLPSCHWFREFCRQIFKNNIIKRVFEVFDPFSKSCVNDNEDETRFQSFPHDFGWGRSLVLEV